MPDAKEKIHVGVIMDGNRRWAAERKQSPNFGHLMGFKKIKPVIEWFNDFGVNILSFYAFSTENWSRSADERNYIMKLFEEALINDTLEIKQKNYRLLVSGRVKERELPGDLPELCQTSMAETRMNTGGIINICFNYGGRAEIVDAIKKMNLARLDPEQIHEGMIAKYLYYPELPDLNIVYRTGGEKRISNFQIWRSVYSEFIGTERYWPEIEKSDIEKLMLEYAKRKQNYGK